MKRRAFAYWSAQVVGWGVYTVFMMLPAYMFSNSEPHFNKLIGLNLTIGLSCFWISHLFRSYIKRHQWVELPFRQLLPRVILMNLLGAILAQVIIHSVMLTILDWTAFKPIVWGEIPIYTFNVFLIFMIWSIFYFGYHYFEQSRRSKMEKLKAENALKDAELIALKAQINPHFLFNALNNIRAMVLEDQMKARDMISNLSDLLRYSIQFNEHEQVALRDEINIVRDYLQLETVQYENRLDYKLEVDSATLEKKIPPMVIQLLVENAVKHGVSQLPGGGQIRVRTFLQDNDLIIQVENTGTLKSKEKSSGIGIKNAIERIRILFAIEPYFDLSESNGKVLATIKVPAVT